MIREDIKGRKPDPISSESLFKRRTGLHHKKIFTIAIELSRPELIPKSVILGSPLRLINRLAGLMSRCTKCLTLCRNTKP